MSSSYPYLSVARERKLDYGVVLAAVDVLEHARERHELTPQLLLAVTTLPPADLQVIHAVWRQERNRQAQVRDALAS